MAGITGAVIGGLAGLAGSAMSADATGDAAAAAAEAAQFRPFDFFGGGLGGINFEDGYGRARMAPGIERALQGILRNTNSPLAGLGSVLQTGAGAARDLPGLYDSAQRDIGRGVNVLQGATNQFSGDVGDLRSMLPGILSGSTGEGVVDDSSQFALNQARGLLTGGPGDIIGDTLSRLRAQARPAEERAVNSRVQQLFNRGILSNTSGARALGELGLSQEMADIERQQVAESIGLQRFNSRQNAGRGLFSLGQSGMLSGRQLNQVGTSLGLQGINTGFDLSRGLFDSRGMLASAIQNRGLNRVNLAQGMFGFGQNADTANINTRIAGLNSRFAANQDLRNLIALGINAGGQQSAAGAAQANAIMSGAGSAAGGFLTGAGGALLEAGITDIFED